MNYVFCLSFKMFFNFFKKTYDIVLQEINENKDQQSQNRYRKECCEFCNKNK